MASIPGLLMGLKAIDNSRHRDEEERRDRPQEVISPNVNNATTLGYLFNVLRTKYLKIGKGGETELTTITNPASKR